MPQLKNLLKLMSSKNASDLHLTVGSPPKIRLNGNLESLDEKKFTADDIQNLFKDYLNGKQLFIFD